MTRGLKSRNRVPHIALFEGGAGGNGIGHRRTRKMTCMGYLDLLPTTYYLLPTTYYLLPTTYYLLPTTYYLLPTTYCYHHYYYY